MASKFAGLLSLAMLCLSLSLLVQHSESAAEVDPKVIAQGCDTTQDPNSCVNWLQDNEQDEELAGISKSDLNSIAFFALKKIEKEVVTAATAVAMKLSDDTEKLAPATQQGLSECKDHYLPAVDLIEEAVDSVANRAYPDAIKYLNASALDLSACQKSLTKFQLADGVTGKPTTADKHAIEAINHRDSLATHVAMAQSIVELAASTPSASAGAANPLPSTTTTTASASTPGAAPPS